MSDSRRPQRSAEAFAHGLPAAILLYTTWVWAGTRPSLHLIAVLLAAVLLCTLLLAGGRVAGAVARDPIFWIGLAFLLLLVAAWLNAGRIHYFDVGLNRWAYTPARWPDAPAAYSRSEAAEALGWFFPAWAMAVALRSPLASRASLAWLVRGSALSAAALAAFGLIQFAAGARGPYGLVRLTCDFFASFAYSNHAAAFFLLAAALSAGLLLTEFARGGGARLCARTAPWLAGTAGGLAGTCLSLSRAGVLLSILLASAIMGYGAWLGRHVFPPSDRARFAAGSVVVILLVGAAVAVLGRHLIRREFTPPPSASTRTHLNLSLSGRPLFARAAWRMWLDHTLWGVGAGGFKYTVADYLPAERIGELKRRGWANVHCDPLQFLVEHGLVGGLLLAGALLALLWPAAAAFDVRAPLMVMGGIGLVLVGVFALIDLPLRCPAVLYESLVVLISLPHLRPGALTMTGAKP